MGKNSRRSPRISRGGATTGMAIGTPGSATIPRVLQISQSIPGKPVFPALFRLSSRGSTHTTVALGRALWESTWESHEGKPQILDPREGKRDTAATAREEIARACPHSRRGLTPLGRLQKYPKIHVRTGEETSDLAPTPHKVLGPDIDWRGNPRGPREATEKLAWGLAFPEATRAGP